MPPQTHPLSQCPPQHGRRLRMLQVWSHQGRVVLPASDSVAASFINSWDGNSSRSRVTGVLVSCSHRLPRECNACSIHPLDSSNPAEIDCQDKGRVTERHCTAVVFLNDQTSSFLICCLQHLFSTLQELRKCGHPFLSQAGPEFLNQLVAQEL